MDSFRCSRCHYVKPVSAFTAKKDRKSGVSSACKACLRAVQAARRLLHPERRDTLAPDIREKRRANDRASYRRHHEKMLAKNKSYREGHRDYFRVKSTQYRLEHLTELRSRDRAYHQTHRDYRLRVKSAYRESHREEINAKSRAYTKAHPEQNALGVARYKAKMRQAARVDFTVPQWRTMKDLLDHRCVYCDRQMARLTMDHLTPIIAGGSHTLWNILPACQSCNSRKRHGPILCAVQPFLLLP